MKVPDVQPVLLALGDSRDSTGDLATDEDLAAPRGLMVEQDPVACVELVGFPVIHRRPERVELRAAIRRTRIERCLLILGLLESLPEELGR